jgi:hypothetical protein
MSEALTLTTPLVQTRTTYAVKIINLDWDSAHIHIRLLGSDGVVVGFNYDGPQAITLMTALNKVNLSVKSLQRRILEQLVADGFLTGTVGGSPD